MSRLVDTNRLRVLFFDAYGTLVSLNRFQDRVQEELKARQVDLPISLVEAACQEEMRYCAERSWGASDRRQLAALRRECSHILHEAFLRGKPGYPLQQEDILEVLMASLVFRAYDDVVPVLEKLSAADLQLAVISNWDCSLPEILEELGLARYFKSVTVSATCGSSKPDAGIFRAALRAAGSMPDQAVHVGDKWDLDVEGPRSAGIQPIHLCRDEGCPAMGGAPVVPVIRKLTDLTKILTSS